MRFEGVEKRYGDFPALRHLDLSIAPGEFLTLLGPSGSGKTTLLSMIAGFENVSGGAIYLDDRRLDTLPPEKRNVGMVVQNYALFPHMSVYRNVAFPLRMRRIGRTEAEAMVSRALDLVELWRSERQVPEPVVGRASSSGSRSPGPSCSNRGCCSWTSRSGRSDRRLRESVQFELIAMHRKLSTTVVYVTHDQVEALTMSNRIVVLREGRVQQVGTPREIYESPANRFVANFIGNSIALDGTVRAIEDGTCRLATGSGIVLCGSAAPGMGPGDTATLMVRPERIDLGPRQPGRGIPATVTERLFMGEHTRYSLRLGTAPRWRSTSRTRATGGSSSGGRRCRSCGTPKTRS